MKEIIKILLICLFGVVSCQLKNTDNNRQQTTTDTSISHSSNSIEDSTKFVPFFGGLWQIESNGKIELVQFDYEKRGVGTFYVSPTHDHHIAFIPFESLEMVNGSNLWIYEIKSSQYQQINFEGKPESKSYALVLTNFICWMPNGQELIYRVFSRDADEGCNYCSSTPDPNINYGYFLYNIKTGTKKKLNIRIERIVCPLANSDLLIITSDNIYYKYNIKKDSIFSSNFPKTLCLQYPGNTDKYCNFLINYSDKYQDFPNKNIIVKINLNTGEKLEKIEIPIESFPTFFSLSPIGKHISYILTNKTERKLIVDGTTIITKDRTEIFQYDWVNEETLILFSDNKIKIMKWKSREITEPNSFKSWVADHGYAPDTFGNREK